MSNSIIIRGGTFSQVKKALKQWLDLNSQQISSDFSLELKHVDRSVFVVEAPQDMDNEFFYYLVNYLKYPEDIFYKADIVGYTVGKDSNRLLGKKLMVFVAQNDDEYDNVSFTDEDGKAYFWSFGKRIKEVELQRAYEPVFEYSEMETSEVLKPNLNRKKDTKREEFENITDRFKIVLIGLIALYISFILLFVFSSNSIRVTNYYCWYEGAIAIWFFLDYKMLQYQQFYQRCLIIAILILASCLVIMEYIELNDPMLFLIAGFTPFFLLLVQWPLRRLFLLSFEKEPEVEDRTSFLNMAYTFILLLGTVFLIYLIADFFY